MSNKVALITGSSGGIGSAIAKELASKNYNIILHYNENIDSIKELEQFIKDNYNVSYLIVKCDLTNEQEIKDMIDKSIECFDHIDILVNNAAIEITNDFDLKTKEDFIKTLDINLVAPFLLSKYISKYMLKNKYGKIVNITSNNGINKYDPVTLEYDASKAGLISLTHNLALELAPYINVNAIAPGWIKTKKVSDLNDSVDGMLEQEESKKILVNRFGKPEEVAKLISFLVSDDASYINNQVITIDGGVR